jgi:hypothetical protein
MIPGCVKAVAAVMVLSAPPFSFSKIISVFQADATAVLLNA